jgi:nitroreductase
MYFCHNGWASRAPTRAIHDSRTRPFNFPCRTNQNVLKNNPACGIASHHLAPIDKEGSVLQDLVLKNRSYRRFDESFPIAEQTLKELVELARLTPSGANLQPLKYRLSSDPDTNGRIFSTLAWAGYLKEWPGPVAGERPTAYVTILGDTAIAKNFGCDHGIAAQTILLGAVERGLGSCIIGNIRHDELRQALNLPERYEILLVLALGKPVEAVVVESLPADGSVKYWRDDKSVHHVPKRSLAEIIL